MKNDEFPNLKMGATPKELYDRAIEIARQNPDKAKRYYNALVEFTKGTSLKPLQEGDAEAIVKLNIGYWAGYFEAGTIELVHQVYGCNHPYFGSKTPSDPKAALELGMLVGRHSRNLNP